MQYQNDDMDDLFRRAADGYPLKLQDEGWDAIAGKLAASGAVATSIVSKKSKENKYKLVILALLILIVSGTTLFFALNKENKNIKNNFTLKNKESIKTSPGDKYYPDNNVKNNAISISEAINPINPVIGEKTTSSKTTKQILVYPSYTKTSITNANISYTDELVKKKNELKENENKPDENNTKIQDINNENSIVKISQVKQEDKIETKIEKSKEIIFAKSGNGNEKKKIKRKNIFYIGILAGPQFNEVKSQGFSNPGFSVGLLTGVNITKSLAFETGLFISQKKYFSSGEYFNMKTVAASMPVGMKVISLNGKSTVLEIPLKLKYDFLKKNNGSFFGTVGASSYILTKETNKYLVDVNGNQQKLTRNYSNNGKYVTAELNLSAGYDYKLKQKTIRIEPYVQLPMKGIGVGSMPIMSTGIHVGVFLHPP